MEERSAKGLRDAMTRASRAAVKEKKSDYDKLLAIANPKHGPQFLAEVCFIHLGLLPLTLD